FLAGFLNRKVPNTSGKARFYWPAKHLFIEGENVAGRPPELTNHTENDFPAWIFRQSPEACLNDRLKCDLPGEAPQSFRMRDNSREGSESHQALDDGRAAQICGP